MKTGRRNRTILAIGAGSLIGIPIVALAVGYKNSDGISASSDYDAGLKSLSAGYGNTAYDHSITSGAYNTAIGLASGAIGGDNYIETEYSFAAGYSNYLVDGASDYIAIALGFDNISVAGSNLIMIGDGNSGVDNSITVGFHLNGDSDAVVAGKYNSAAGADASFVVGCGTSNGSRKNAIEVYDGGQIIMKSVQGDISMGAYQ